jgi:hypothetical protein
MRAFERSLNNYNPTSKLIQDHFIKPKKKSTSGKRISKDESGFDEIYEQKQHPYLFPAG